MKHKTAKIFLTLFLILPLLIFTGCADKKHGLSESLMHKGEVTKTFKQANLPNSVIFYDEKTTPDIALNDFDVSEYHQIDLLMYSDGCERCNNNKTELVKGVKRLIKKRDLVILINSNQNLKPLRKHFKFPKDYTYPTVFSFDKNEDGEIRLVNQSDLDIN